MKFKIQKATRKKAKARIGISGPSGSGKTLSSLLIAFGLCDGKEDPKVGVIDTEQHSAELYAPEFEHLGGYYTITIEPPFEVQNYIDAIAEFEKAGFDVIIIDSLSHAWAGTGGLLDFHGSLVDRGSNPFTAWREVTPLHNKLVEKMLQSPAHVIATLRAKEEYVIQDIDGKKQVVKVGLSPIQRDGMQYEFTIFFELSWNHTCRATKDRTGLFDQKIFTPTLETGKIIKEFLESGQDVPNTANRIRTPDSLEALFETVQTLDELKALWETLVPAIRRFPKQEQKKCLEIKDKFKEKLRKKEEEELEKSVCNNNGSIEPESF